MEVDMMEYNGIHLEITRNMICNMLQVTKIVDMYVYIYIHPCIHVHGSQVTMGYSAFSYDDYHAYQKNTIMVYIAI